MVEEIIKKEISTETQIMGDELEKRKKQIVRFFKERGAWVYSLILALVVFIGIHVRVLNLSKLKDITTGTWTLGPDLDPFLFLRWAKYIVEHGKLMVIDAMRNAPLADICSGAQCYPINTSMEMKLLPNLIAWLYHLLSIFSKDVTVTYAAIIFPVVMFGLTIVAFFLFARKIFYKWDKNKRNIIALISTALFALIPSLLARTIAGIPEKESAGFFFIFISLYFFLEAFTSEKLKRGIIFGILAGAATGALGLVWGAVIFIFIIIPISVLIAFFMGKVNAKEFYIYFFWMASSVITVIPFSIRYSLDSLMLSTSSQIMFLVFLILLTDFLIFNKKIFGISEKLKKIKIPKRILSAIIAVGFLVILTSIIFGPSFITRNIGEFIDQTIHPAAQNRFTVTVAENKLPYFADDWKNEFGPTVLNISLYFWMFFIGAVFLFNYLIKPLSKKEKNTLNIWIFCLSFLPDFQQLFCFKHSKRTEWGSNFCLCCRSIIPVGKLHLHLS